MEDTGEIDINTIDISGISAINSNDNDNGKKTNIFTKFFRKIFKKRSVNNRKIAMHSRFGHYLENISPNDEMYASACEVVTLCDESVSVVAQKLMTVEKLKHLDAQLAELECFNNMSNNDAANLKELLERFSSLGRDKNTLKYQITSFDSSLAKMEDLEGEASNAIVIIKDAEDKQRIFKNDISYLQGEKEELEYERERLLSGMNFIYKFTIGLVIVFTSVIIALVFLFAFREASIFFPLSIVCVLVIISISMLYSLRRRMRFELAMNVKKQKKAVEMLNTKSVVYAYYTNFLSYEYSKFKVRSSEMLQSNLKDYENYKHLTKRFDAIRSIMGETEEEISKLLREYNISNVAMSLDNFAKTFNIDDKKQYYNDLVTQKQAIEKDMSALDKRQEQIWDYLIMYEESDSSEEHIIHEIIHNYMQHVSKMISRPEPDNKKPEDEQKNETEPVVVLNENGNGENKQESNAATMQLISTKKPSRKKYGFDPPDETGSSQNEGEYLDIAKTSV